MRKQFLIAVGLAVAVLVGFNAHADLDVTEGAALNGSYGLQWGSPIGWREGDDEECGTADDTGPELALIRDAGIPAGTVSITLSGSVNVENLDGTLEFAGTIWTGDSETWTSIGTSDSPAIVGGTAGWQPFSTTLDLTTEEATTVIVISIHVPPTGGENDDLAGVGAPTSSVLMDDLSVVFDSDGGGGTDLDTNMLGNGDFETGDTTEPFDTFWWAVGSWRHHVECFLAAEGEGEGVAEGEGEGASEGEGELPSEPYEHCPMSDTFMDEGAVLVGWSPPDDWMVGVDYDGDEILDNYSFELLAAVLCDTSLPHSAGVVAQYTFNVDTAEGGAGAWLWTYNIGYLICGYSTISTEGRDAQEGFTGPGLAPYTAGKAINEPLSSTGDLDGDGLTNKQEYDNVMARGGTPADYVEAATTPILTGAGPLPVATAAGLGALAAALLTAGYALRRRQK